ncbi:MAG TPA: NAD(P)H-binding protein [Gemmatimonadales bacterium]
MNIVVFGASGATGREIVAQGIQQGHTVRAFVRTPGKLTLTHQRLTVAAGDITDPRAVERAVGGRQAVLFALGAANPVPPYPPLTEGLRSLLHAMGLAAVHRLIYLSSNAVSASRQHAGLVARHLAWRLLNGATTDHEANEHAIMQSRLDWTIVRAPKLTNGAHTGRVRSGEQEQARWPIQLLSRADVADVMLRQLMDTTFVRKAANVFPA